MNPFPRRARQFIVGYDDGMVYIPREDRNWTPEAPIKRFRIAGQARVATTSGGLRLRKTPINGDTVMELPQSAIVDVGPSDTPGWSYVEFGGRYGFASNQYLEPVGGPDWDPKPIPPAPAPAPTPAPYVPPPAPPAPPPAEGTGLGAKIAITALVLTLVGLPTYMILKKPSRASYA